MIMNDSMVETKGTRQRHVRRALNIIVVAILTTFFSFLKGPCSSIGHRVSGISIFNR